MARWMAGLIAAGALAAAGRASAAAPVAGRWLTPENNGVVEITDCGGGVCGRVVTSDRIKLNPDQKDVLNKDVSLRGRTIKGLQLFDTMMGGPKVWRGKVYNPADGGTYSGSVQLVSAGKMKLTGCIVWPLCKSQTWTRID